MSRQKLSLKKIVVALSIVSLVVLASGVKESAQPSLFSFQQVLAQTARPEDMWQLVYQQLPDLPQENQYISKETGKVDPNNTLVSRLIRYHTYVKGRPPNYRLDWKLTLADYLGANELMEETRYPGYDTLRQNPVDGDRAVIGRLNRKQRDALVQTIVDVFNGNYSVKPAPDSSVLQPSAEPSPAANPNLPQP